MATKYSRYKIIFRNGTSVILDNANIVLDIEDRAITKITFKRLPNGDAVDFIDIGEILCVVRTPIKRWFNK